MYSKFKMAKNIILLQGFPLFAKFNFHLHDYNFKCKSTKFHYLFCV